MMEMSLVPEMMGLVANTGTGTSTGTILEKPNKNNSNNNSSSSQPTKRKKSMTSQYLKYFETAPDGKTRKCKFCKQSYSTVTATGNLARHLANHHPGYNQHIEEISPISVSAPTKKSNSQSTPQPKSQIQQTQSKNPQIDFDQVNWFLLKFLLDSSLPNSTSQSKSLLDSYKFLNPKVNVWSTEKAEQITNQLFHSMREEVRASLQYLPSNSKVSLTLDFWTSYEEILYMSVTSHWIDATWQAHNVLLEVSHIPYPRSSTEILNALTRVILSFHLDSKVISLTSDTSQLATQACQLLKEEMESRKINFFYVPCGAHLLKTVINECLMSVKGILSKVREFVVEMGLDKEVLEGFKQMLAIYQEGPLKFPIDASSSWNGDYALLDLVYKASNSMDSIIKKHEESFGGGCNLLLSPSEKSVITILHQFLDQFHKTTTNLCTTKTLTLGLVLFFTDHIIELINSYKENSRHDWLKTLAEQMHKRTEIYNGLTGRVYNGFAFICAILDPRIKRELLPDLLNLEKNFEEARGYFVREYCSNHFMGICSNSSNNNGFGGACDNVSTSCSADLDAVSFAEEIARKRRRANMNITKDELSQYLTEPPAPLSSDVLHWWKVNSARFPRLADMARDFLAVQGTSISPDQLFTSECEELNRRRYCLGFGSVQRVLCVGEWVKQGFRFRVGDLEVDFEKLVERSGGCE
ncbi:hypothetical protein LUZ60_009833 [Juncus effusus]|nr:hypothetical protein LUZ60_009833 [Juncus effusus]